MHVHTQAHMHQEFSENWSHVVGTEEPNHPGEIIGTQIIDTGKVFQNMNSQLKKKLQTLQISHSELISRTKKPFGQTFRSCRYSSCQIQNIK